jgi:phospholipid transport system substrate-binding protein
MMRRVFVLALVLCFGLAGPAAAQEQPPTAVIQNFYGVLLQVMKSAKQLGFQGREKQLAPIIDKTFNLSLMTRLAVGPEWAKIDPAMRQRLVQAFRDMTVATYAGRFDGYSGERFVVSPQTTDAAGGKLVKTQIIKSDGEPVELDYLMRKAETGWKILDVFLKGTVSELATRRSEFTSVLRREGPQALLQVMQRKAAAEAAG